VLSETRVRERERERERGMERMRSGERGNGFAGFAAEAEI